MKLSSHLNQTEYTWSLWSVDVHAKERPLPGLCPFLRFLHSYKERLCFQTMAHSDILSNIVRLTVHYYVIKIAVGAGC